MTRILGLDLGTSSIGWAVRDTQMGEGIEQIIYKGVVIFTKGVGEGKSGEFSLAAERTQARSARRRNQRRRWRKIELLALLIDKGMCPLPIRDLNEWKFPGKKSHRIYPTNDLFINWLRLDFNNDAIPEYINPFELRDLALKRVVKLNELGRIFYHFIQRRGYLSNRSEKAREQDVDEVNGEEESLKSTRKAGKVATAIREFEDQLNGDTIGQKLHKVILNGGRARRRKEENTNVSRLTLQDEYNKIANFQGLNVAEIERIRKIIFDQRPLRSQKHSIGKCIYEKKKSRCPISHPEFELYRMWQVINNIKYSTDNRKTWQSLNTDERKIIQDKFFRKSSPVFPFSDISKIFKKASPERIFNYRDNQSIAGCPTLTGLRSVFGEERVWEMRKSAQERIQWEEDQKKDKGLKYPKKKLDLYDIWHWLFVMDNDKDQLIVRQRAIDVLGLANKEADNFVRVTIKQGYSNLSLKAIRKINYWLEVGEKYDQSVFLANIPYIFGSRIWEDNKDELMKIIQVEIEGISFEKNAIDIANGLIKQYNNLSFHHRFAQNEGYKLEEDDRNDVRKAITGYFGNIKWGELSEDNRLQYEQRVTKLYGEALLKGSKVDLPFFKLPRLDNKIKERLRILLHIPENSPLLDKLYHPSEIEFFLPAIQEKDKQGILTGRRLLNAPRTGSIRNPMAMRALHELRKLINHLLREDIIDEHTVVVVEMARELNDANQRKAIDRYQRERDTENKLYAEEIRKIFDAQNKTLPGDLSAYIQRYRLREEQPHRACIYTGKTISDTDLFDEFTTDIEHTLPRSLTFDDSLENKTIAFKYYNNEIKSQLIPTQLPNYEEDAQDYSAIVPRLEDWRQKVAEYESKVEACRFKSKIAATKEAKDKAIQARHYFNMHLVYWRKKLERFTLTELTERFKNSQLVDTQLITKYGLMYLKTLFYNVRATKGLLTDRIKRMWGALHNDEAKDRSQHIHHVLDAIIQTLLHKERSKPDVYTLLAMAYKESESSRMKVPDLPNPWGMTPSVFHASLQKLLHNVIAYHAERDRIFKQTKQKIKMDVGKSIYLRGSGIRASLHKDTFYGAIKVPVVENGKFVKDEAGNLLLEKDDKGIDIVKYRSGFVFRGSSLEEIRNNIENIVDERLRELARQTGAATIHKQGYFEIPPSKERLKKNAASEATKVFKVKVFARSLLNPLQIKQHKDVVKEHKRWYYTQTDGNYLMALYSNETERDFELINTYQLSELIKEGQGLYPLSKQKVIRGKVVHLNLNRRNGKDIVLKKGVKVLLYNKSPDEIFSDQSTQNISDRLYKIHGLNISRQKTGGKYYHFGNIQLMHHLEARSLGELKLHDGEYKFGEQKYYRKMNHNQFNALIEGIDFKLERDGRIFLI